jgi:hypothetical protein
VLCRRETNDMISQGPTLSRVASEAWTTARVPACGGIRAGGSRGVSRCVSRTAALWPTYNPQDRKVEATCDSTPFFGKYDIAEWVGCARAVTLGVVLASTKSHCPPGACAPTGCSDLRRHRGSHGQCGMALLHWLQVPAAPRKACLRRPTPAYILEML